jgi:hypothetical protein
MALFVPVPNVAKIQIKGRSSDLSWANVLHVSYAGAPPNLASVNDLATNILGAFAAQMLTWMPTASHVDEVVVTDLSSASSNVGSDSTTSPGTNGGGLIPASAACLVDYPISLRYRGGHPRTYLFVGVDSSLVDQSNWTDTFVGEIQVAWGNVLGSFIGQTYDGTSYGAQCAVSYRSGGAPRVTPVVLPFVTGSYQVQKEVASQRRRMRRRT